MASPAQGDALQIAGLLGDPVSPGVARVYAPRLQASDTGQALDESLVLRIPDGLFRFVDRPRIDLRCLMHDSEYTKAPTQSQALFVLVRFVLAYLRRVAVYWDGCRNSSRSTLLQAVRSAGRRGRPKCRQRSARRQLGRRPMSGGQRTGPRNGPCGR